MILFHSVSPRRFKELSLRRAGQAGVMPKKDPSSRASSDGHIMGTGNCIIPLSQLRMFSKAISHLYGR